MDKCEHGLAEKETACYADTLCPICLAAENRRYKNALEKIADTFCPQPIEETCPQIAEQALKND